MDESAVWLVAAAAMMVGTVEPAEKEGPVADDTKSPSRPSGVLNSYDVHAMGLVLFRAMGRVAVSSV